MLGNDIINRVGGEEWGSSIGKRMARCAVLMPVSNNIKMDICQQSGHVHGLLAGSLMPREGKGVM